MRRVFLLFAALFLALTAASVRAQEACEETTTGACYPEYITISAITATDDGYTAVAVAGSDLELLRLDADANIVDRFLLPPPDWLPNQTNMPAIDKLVTGAAGSVMGVGTVTSGNQQIGAVFYLSPDNRTQWSAALFVDAESSVILYSGAYDPADQRYLVVGRHTNGADTGSCSKWSRGLILSIPENDITNLAAYFEGPQEAGLENRVAFYDIAPTGSRGEFVATGFATSPAPGGGCQDNAVAVNVRGGATSQWSVGSRFLIGSPDENEVAFAVSAIDSRTFLIAGQGTDTQTGARAAFLAEFGFFGSAPALRYDPFPEDGSDRSGGDRYRTLTRLGSGSVIVSGSVSESRQARNQGIWRVQAPGMGGASPLNFLTREAGSDIFATALGADGRVLAVGRHGAGRGDVGWMGFVFGQKLVVDRRDPDPNLELLTPQQARAGSLTLTANDVSSGFGYRDIRFGAGLEYEVRFTIDRKTDIAASALPLDGDLDLVLVDANDSVLAISANRGSAGEFTIADLEPGDYTLKVVAIADVGEYELRIRSGQSLSEPVLESLNALHRDGRNKLAEMLSASGYLSPASADIGFGAAALASLLAYYNSFNTVIDVAGVQQFIASASLAVDE
jgi:hypothetical protein